MDKKHSWKNFFYRHVLHVDSRKEIPANFGEELHRQSRKYLFFSLLIASLAWIPYLPADRQLHPEIPALLYIRLGLTIFAGLALILQFQQIFVKKARTVMFVVGIYLLNATGLITGLTGGDPVYVGGYLFILMVIIVIPLFKYEAFILLFTSLATFFTSLLITGIDFSDPRFQYSLRDILSTTVVVLAFTYVLDHLRYKTYLNSMEIIKDRSILQQKNLNIEKEMRMARSIQEKFIPSVSPHSWIAHFYKPMEMVGGDYFDYILFRNQEKIGIFLSDVSGHGVPAAFITSMLKSFLLQAGELRNDPAKVLYYLNDILQDHSGNQFVTAMYAVIDHSKKEMAFANAGHNPPLLIRDGKVSELRDQESGIPLAIMSNQEIQKNSKLYYNQKVRLEKDDRIFLYTDGLTDAVSKKDPHKDYSEALNTILIQMKDQKGDQLLQEIYWDLVSYHGSEDFEDDICMISIDIN